jgi:hypothetical protein
MTFVHELAATEAASVCGLVVAAVVLASFGAAQMAFASMPVVAPGPAAGLVFTYTLLIGLLPAALFGAPLYAALRQFKSKVTWPLALLIGVVPGLLALLYELHLGLWSIAGGGITAAVTHGIRKWRQKAGS